MNKNVLIPNFSLAKFHIVNHRGNNTVNMGFFGTQFFTKSMQHSLLLDSTQKWQGFFFSAPKNENSYCKLVSKHNCFLIYGNCLCHHMLLLNFYLQKSQ